VGTGGEVEKTAKPQGGANWKEGATRRGFDEQRRGKKSWKTMLDKNRVKRSVQSFEGGRGREEN